MLPTPAKLLVTTLLVAFLPSGALAQKKRQRSESKSGQAAAASESSAPKRPRADPIHGARAPKAERGLREGQSEAAAKGEAEQTDEAAGEEDVQETEETEETDEAERAGAASEPARPGPEARPSPLELLLAIRGFSRRFEFEDDLFGVMRRYELGAAPAVSLAVHWYPLAHSQGGLLAHLGVMAGYERGVLISTVNDTADLETSTWAFFAGVRARLPLGAQELGVSATYGQHSFTIEGDEARPFPDVKYSYLRPALDASFRIERVSFGFHVGHRFLFSTGELGSELWFPRLDGAGFDAGVFVGQALLEALEVRAGVDLRRYYFTMNPVVGDRYVVGGGVDQYLSLWVGLHYRLPRSD